MTPTTGIAVVPVPQSSKSVGGIWGGLVGREPTLLNGEVDLGY
jgi:hypothetical protein